MSIGDDPGLPDNSSGSLFALDAGSGASVIDGLTHCAGAVHARHLLPFAFFRRPTGRPNFSSDIDNDFIEDDEIIGSKNRDLFVFPVKPELSPIWRPEVRLSSDQISINAIGRRLKEKIRRKSKVQTR
jgi:hypothetical protein